MVLKWAGKQSPTTYLHCTEILMIASIWYHATTVNPPKPGYYIVYHGMQFEDNNGYQLGYWTGNGWKDFESYGHYIKVRLWCDFDVEIGYDLDSDCSECNITDAMKEAWKEV